MTCQFYTMLLLFNIIFWIKTVSSNRILSAMTSFKLLQLAHFRKIVRTEGPIDFQHQNIKSESVLTGEISTCVRDFKNSLFCKGAVKDTRVEELLCTLIKNYY